MSGSVCRKAEVDARAGRVRRAASRRDPTARVPPGCRTAPPHRALVVGELELHARSAIPCADVAAATGRTRCKSGLQLLRIWCSRSRSGGVLQFLGQQLRLRPPRAAPSCSQPARGHSDGRCAIAPAPGCPGGEARAVGIRVAVYDRAQPEGTREWRACRRTLRCRDRRRVERERQRGLGPRSRDTCREASVATSLRLELESAALAADARAVS